MKTIKIWMIATVLIGISPALAAFAGHKNSNAGIFDKGFAVVELFTSEGCSSCPPADQLVARIQKEMSHKPVYILAYHVDYWNRLGWKDVFSKADYSKRQNQYAGWLNLQSIYTPQIVINGKTEFIGSEEGKLRSAIKAALQKTNPLQLSIDVSNVSHNAANIQYKINGDIDYANDVLVLALIQKQATTNVKRGENSGHTLTHVQIVRNLQNIPLSKISGSTTIVLPAGFSTQAYEVIGFVQDTGSGTILGASKTAFEIAVSADNHQDGKNKKI